MKIVFGLALGLIISVGCFAQVKIHSHNDYLQTKPFFSAYANRVYEMEADVFLVGDSLLVAHSKKEIMPSNTLYSLYLKPIVETFKEHHKKVSNDKTIISKRSKNAVNIANDSFITDKNKLYNDEKYSFSLMIDVKENWDLVYPSLKKEIEKYGKIFNRHAKNTAIQIVISGSRPDYATFNSYPRWLFFDGLPNITYAKKDLKRITMISDDFANYSKWKGVGEIPEADKDKLRKVITSAHQLQKPIRFWGAPDTETCWKQLVGLGADIINTDKIAESNEIFPE